MSVSSPSIPTKVLAVIDTIQISGPGRQLAAIVAPLAASGVSLKILMYHRSGRPTSPFEKFLQAQGIDHAVVRENGRFDLRALAATRHEIDEWAPDIVQTHGYKPGAVIFALRLAGMRRPWIAFYHGSTAENVKVRLFHSLDRRVMRRAEAIVVMSRLHQAEFADRSGSTAIVYNAMLNGQIDVAQRRARESGSPPSLAVVGRLSHEKGVDVLLRACELLRVRGVEFRLVVVGDGPDRSALERLAVDAKIASQVEFIGHVSDPTMIYHEADLLVIPSRSEGLPNVLLEAINHDVPCVATMVGAIPEVLVDPTAGLLCPPNDPHQLATAIESALAPAYARAGSAARREIARRFSLTARSEQLREVYARVMPGQSPIDNMVRPASSPMGPDR